MSVSNLTDEIARYIQERANAKLAKHEKEAVQKRKKFGEDEQSLAELEEKQKKEQLEIEAHFTPVNWLTDAAKRAKQISMVTHALKYTHTDAKGSSLCNTSQHSNQSQLYVSTASLSNPALDVVGNAAALDVAGLLQLQANNRQLIDFLAQDDGSPLRPFAENEEQLKEWLVHFKSVLQPKEVRTHELAKQLYFPVGEGIYHLISPLYASSLSQALYERITSSRFSEQAKTLREARRNGKYEQGVLVEFPNIAVQKFGGTKPQNVSQLNSKRHGQGFLLSTQPPVWQTQTRPPLRKDEFWRAYERSVFPIIKELKCFLESTDAHNVKVRHHRAALVDQLLDHFLLYSAEIQTFPAGWSQDSQLSQEERFWLDPRYDEPEFQAQRKEVDWQKTICSKFAGWLNQKLEEKTKLQMGDPEYREWSKLLKRKISLLQGDIEEMTV